jgi:hypothetical protein
VISLRDENPSGTFPIVTIGLILANAFVFVRELLQGPLLDDFLLQYDTARTKDISLVTSQARVACRAPKGGGRAKEGR